MPCSEAEAYELAESWYFTHRSRRAKYMSQGNPFGNLRLRPQRHGTPEKPRASAARLRRGGEAAPGPVIGTRRANVALKKPEREESGRDIAAR